MVCLVYRSYLPSGSSVAPSLDLPLSLPDASSRPPPLYLPTKEDRDAYKTVTVERRVTEEKPLEPLKDTKTIELEVNVYLVLECILGIKV